MLLRQDRGFVIMDRNRHTSECLNILSTEQFLILDRDPINSIKAKVQRAFWKIKDHPSKQEYLRIYPTDSARGKYYGTAKKLKITIIGTINYLPLRPIISNIGTVLYQLVEYLAKLLYPSCTSEYIVANNMEFINHVKIMKIPKDHSFTSFDVKSLFTYVPLKFTIHISRSWWDWNTN